MDKRLIINADDFGLCDGVNRAIVKAHSEGVLTSATIMANMPAAADAVKMAKQLPNLGIGVHLNLTVGQPITKDSFASSLLNGEGEFINSPARLAIFSLIRPAVRNAIRAEFAAQIQFVIDSGLKPTHLDSHKHIHSFPPIFSIVCELAHRFKIPAVRWTFEPKELSKMPWPLPSEGGAKRARLIRIMAKINRVQKASLFKTQALLGVAHTGKIDTTFFRAVALYNSADIAEVMTHPGFIDGLDRQKTRLIQQRQLELETLCSEKTKQYIKDAGIKLVHYGQL
jgi:hopanoid biosynthesis associated protein HpnK